MSARRNTAPRAPGRARRGGRRGWAVSAAAVTIAVGLAAAPRAASGARAEAPSAAEILARNAAARGGADAWQRVQTMVWLGHVESARAPLPSLPFKLEQKRPNRTRLEIQLPGDRSVRAFDGARGWKVRSTRGRAQVEPFSPQEARYAAAGHGLEGPLMDAAARGDAVTVQGIDELGGRKAYHLRVHPARGGVADVWVDAETFLELRADRTTEGAGGAPRRVSAIYGEYHDVEGLKIPFLVATGAGPAAAPDRMRIERVVLNAPLDDATFAMPGAASAAPAAGESIYLRGVLASGAALAGTRGGGGVVATGADAACVSCHQRSGLGTVEGQLSFPPITGEFLFRARAHDASQPVLPYVQTVRGDRAPYTDATLARAIRQGVDAQGRTLDPLMPRFDLDDEDMAALLAYLKGLGGRQVPGVTDTVLQLATIVTPDADPVERDGMLDVLEHFVAEKNSFPFRPSPRMWTSGRTQYSKSMYMANRHWQLHVWRLTGPADGWRAQLEEHLAAEPVFAVLSGLGGSNWQPVHAFCEEHGIPCLFPNVEVPVVSERDFYSLYFSKGVLLEAQLIARAILGADRGPAGDAVEEVYRAGDSGEAAAAALAAELQAHGVTVHRTIVAAGAGRRSVAASLRRAEARGRPLVLWLRPADVAALADVPAGAGPAYLSGLLGGLERAPLPARWRPHTLLTYPFDLPDRRGVRLAYPLGWFAFRHIPLVAERVQTDTYLACSLLADVLNRMADNFSRPYLVEQLQEQLEHRLVTGYYPHLSLATSQRFASKGGYVARFRDARGTALAAAGDWIVP